MKKLILILFSVIFLISIVHADYTATIPKDISGEKLRFESNTYYFENDLNSIKLNYKDGNDVLTVKKPEKDIKDSNKFVNILENTDIKYEKLNNELKETIILKEKPSLINSKEIEISSDLKYDSRLILFTNGKIQTGDFETYGSIQFRDKVMTRFTFPSPYAIDNNGNKIDLKYRVYTTGILLWQTKHISVVIPSDYLINAVYPVEIDPSAISGCDDGTNTVTCADATFTGNYISTTKNITIRNATLNGVGSPGLINLTSGGVINITNSNLNGYGTTNQPGEYNLKADGNIYITNSSVNGYGGDPSGVYGAAGQSGKGTIITKDLTINSANLLSYGTSAVISGGPGDNYPGGIGYLFINSSNIYGNSININSNCGNSLCTLYSNSGNNGVSANAKIYTSNFIGNGTISSNGGGGDACDGGSGSANGGTAILTWGVDYTNFNGSISSVGGAGSNGAGGQGGLSILNSTSRHIFKSGTMNLNSGSGTSTPKSEIHLTVSEFTLNNITFSANTDSANYIRLSKTIYNHFATFGTTTVPVLTLNSTNPFIYGTSTGSVNGNLIITSSYSTRSESNYYNSVQLITPIDNYNTISNEIIFNVTSISTSSTLSNITLYVWGETNIINTTYISGNSNNTIFNYTLGVGQYKWGILTCDNLNTCIQSENRSFIIGFINSASYNPTSYETANENYILNITLGVVPLSVSAIFNYDNLSYPSTVNCINTSCLINNNLDIPLATQDNQNKSFYWNFRYYDGSNSFDYNSSTLQQTIKQINLTECNSGTVALNFTAIDEITQSTINPFEFTANFKYWKGLGLTYRNISIANYSTSGEQICIYPSDINLSVNANIQYTASGYLDNSYYLVNATISNVTNKINLYLLNYNYSTSFIEQVLDYGRNPIVGAYVYIQRCFLGTCNTVQVIQTDSNGESIGFYQTETVDYQHIIIKDGVVIYQDTPHKIFATTVPYTNTFYVNINNPPNFDYTLPSLYESLTYDNNTKLVTYTYIDTSSTFTQGRLLVELMNYSGSYGTVCDSTSSQSSATITCDMSSQPESNYLASAFITRGSTETLVDGLQFTLSNAKEIFGLFGLFLGFLIILTAGMAFLYHPLAGTWMVTIAMIFTNIVGFTSFTAIWIGGAIILSLIFTWFFRE